MKYTISVAPSSAIPTNVKSSCRCEMKIFTGRHGTAVAGIRAMRRHVHASAHPKMTKRELTSNGFPDFAFGCVRNPTDAPSVW
jgi:hypothetical protein